MKSVWKFGEGGSNDIKRAHIIELEMWHGECSHFSNEPSMLS